MKPKSRWRLTALGLSLLLTSIAGAGLWICLTFTLVEAASGEGWLLLRTKQADECKGQVCAVFSEREFGQAVQGAMIHGRQMCPGT